MPEQETTEWSAKGTEPPAGAEVINGEEEYPADWMNNHFWKITTDIGALFAWNDDLTTEISDVETALSSDIDTVASDLETTESELSSDIQGVIDDLTAHTNADNPHSDSAAMSDLYTDEDVEDTVGALLQEGSNISLSYDDGSSTLTIGTSALSEEEVEDAVASLLTADSNLTLSYDDGNDTLTVGLGDDISVTSLDAEHASVSSQPENDTDVTRLEDRYSDTEAQSAVEGNVDASDLSGASGSDGEALVTDGDSADWQEVGSPNTTQSEGVSGGYRGAVSESDYSDFSESVDMYAGGAIISSDPGYQSENYGTWYLYDRDGNTIDSGDFDYGSESSNEWEIIFSFQFVSQFEVEYDGSGHVSWDVDMHSPGVASHSHDI